MNRDAASAKQAMEAAGLAIEDDRAAELAAEAGRIAAGVARVAGPHFGFYDEPIQFLAALEALAEDDA